MNFAVVGLSKRCGMVVKRTPAPLTVLLAISAGVRVPGGNKETGGFLESASAVKSPFRRRWPGNLLLEENRKGVRFQRRSYDPRKKVFLLPGTGPLNEPPSSFKL